MLTIEQTRKALGKEFSRLADSEVEQIRNEIYSFWMIVLEN